ncbi:hypothetical protein HanRHA438_Chr13g0627871 [Helianthus annuus]|nr:hypothetical protein HanRHA438_Chr13g0627871 [Helianthus annuus]
MCLVEQGSFDFAESRNPNSAEPRLKPGLPLRATLSGIRGSPQVIVV